ncbi:50S ribosomal protein L9, partial [SAR202 cluster bacterium AD-804-J14_MRT_500m]|nr:50S ribosomal protein L9 [SAR202 cluster bacterium AD-804-J14_MRT_500m]
MRVLFIADVINVADAGEVKDVADGFARNYLLPKQLATIASPEQLKRVARITRQGNEQRVREMGDWQALADLLEGTTLEMMGKIGPTGQFYGAISVTGIIQALAESTGHTVERRMVELSEPIRQPGE